MYIYIESQNSQNWPFLVGHYSYFNNNREFVFESGWIDRDMAIKRMQYLNNGIVVRDDIAFPQLMQFEQFPYFFRNTVLQTWPNDTAPLIISTNDNTVGDHFIVSTMS